MNILFLHRNFPGQFKHLINHLLKDSSNKITFITANQDVEIEGVEKIVYEASKNVSTDDCLKSYDEAILNGKAVANIVNQMKEKGYKPDVIYTHSWGVGMFMKDIYPDTPLIGYFEWFYNTKNSDFGYITKEDSTESKQKVRCKNADILIDLYSCDMGISPTQWQKSQFPKEFHSKINVIHDGIDTEICKPNKNAKFLNFSANDEVITYTTRGMELYRGFPNFIKAIEILQQKRPSTHFVIAGHDETFYGLKLNGKTYKEIMLEQTNLDLSRVHFVDFLPYEEYIKLLQVSSVHVYLTVPFVLSWSILEAMACGCCVVASSTQPVLEIIKDNQNGLLCEFFNINELVEKIEYALDNPEKIKLIKENARKTILDNYSLEKVLPKHLEILHSKFDV